MGETAIAHLGTKRMETDRLVLRPFAPEDAGDMYANWANDPEVTRYLTWKAHTSESQTRGWLEFRAAQYADPAYYGWCLVLKETGRAIGDLSVVKIYEETRCAEIGWVLGRAFWGRGLMPEAGRAVIDFLLDEAGFNRVQALHDLKNPKSGRAMLKCGLRYEGALRQYGRNSDGELIDEAIYAILKNDARRKDRLD